MHDRDDAIWSFKREKGNVTGDAQKTCKHASQRDEIVHDMRRVI